MLCPVSTRVGRSPLQCRAVAENDLCRTCHWLLFDRAAKSGHPPRFAARGDQPVTRAGLVVRRSQSEPRSRLHKAHERPVFRLEDDRRVLDVDDQNGR